MTDSPSKNVHSERLWHQTSARSLTSAMRERGYEWFSVYEFSCQPALLSGEPGSINVRATYDGLKWEFVIPSTTLTAESTVETLLDAMEEQIRRTLNTLDMVGA